METSLALKRFHHQLQPMYIRFENDFDRPDIVTYLRNEKGHGTVRASPLLSAFASIVGISNRNGKVEAKVDPRRGGKACTFDP